MILNSLSSSSRIRCAFMATVAVVLIGDSSRSSAIFVRISSPARLEAVRGV